MQPPRPPRPPVPPLAQQHREQEAKHAGLRYAPGQRVLDLVTKREGEIVSGQPASDSSSERYVVQLAAVWTDHQGDIATGNRASSFSGFPAATVSRTLTELTPIPAGLRSDLADLDNPKL